MKKSLFAIAAVTAFAGAAHAQSSVTVYGLIDMGITSTGTDSTLRASGVENSIRATQTGNNGRMSGSRLGFRGVEDLGGGRSAGFTLEMGPDFTEQANGINTGTRLGFLSLNDKAVGGLNIGRQVSSTKAVNDGFTAFGNANFDTGAVAGAGLSTSTVSQTTGAYAAVSNAATQGGLGNANGGERLSNLIRYTTPALIPGLTASAGYFKTTADTQTAAIVIGDTNGAGYDLGLRYTQGPFDAMIAYNKYETTNGSANMFANTNTVMSLGTSYDLKMVKGFVAYNNRAYEVTTTANSKITFTDVTVGVSVPLGTTNILFAYSDGKDDSTVQKTDKSGFQLGAVHNLSKRTNVYAVYGNAKADSASLGISGNSKVSATGTAIGMRHSF